MSILLSAQIKLPDPPFEKLCLQDQDSFKFDAFGKTTQYKNRCLLTVSGHQICSAYNYPMISESATAWARSNVSDAVIDMRYTYTEPGKIQTGPHCDMSRNYAVIYLLDAGGTDHHTTFYQEYNQPLIRAKGYHVDDYNRVHRIFRMQIALHQWTLINTRVLHGVENIGLGRSAVQISLEQIPSDWTFCGFPTMVDQ